MNNKWGFIDRTGKLVVPIKYDSGWIFVDGLAYVEVDNKWGFIDKADNIVISSKNLVEFYLCAF